MHVVELLTKMQAYNWRFLFIEIAFSKPESYFYILQYLSFSRHIERLYLYFFVYNLTNRQHVFIYAKTYLHICKFK